MYYCNFRRIYVTILYYYNNLFRDHLLSHGKPLRHFEVQSHLAERQVQ